MQALSKSTTEVHFETPSIEGTNALAGINKLAFWPETKEPGSGYTLVSIPLVAERLSDKLDVVSSLTVLQVMQSNSIPTAFADITAKEQKEACGLITEKTGADAVLCCSPSDMKVDSRFFTFKRSSRTYDTQIQIFAKGTNDFVWRDVVVLVVKQGSTMPSDQDIAKYVTAKLSDKLLEIMGKKSAAQATQTK